MAQSGTPPDKPKVATAWGMFPDAASAISACMGARAEPQVFPPIIPKVKKFLDTTSPEALAALPDRFKIDTARGITQTQEGYALKGELLKTALANDKGLEAWEKEREAKFLRTLGTDAKIAEIRKDPSTDVKHRMDFARRLNEIHLQAYGVKPTPLVEFTQDHDGHSVPSGGYRPDGKIQLNTVPEAILRFGTIPEVTALVVHEGTHHIERMMGLRWQQINDIETKALKTYNVTDPAKLNPEQKRAFDVNVTQEIKKLPADSAGWDQDLRMGGRLANAGRVFHDSISSYMMPEDVGLQIYLKNPAEIHSRRLGNNALDFIHSSTSNTERKAIIDTLEREAKEANTAFQTRTEQRSADIKSPALCP